MSAATIAIVLLLLIAAVLGLRYYMRRLSSGCCGGGDALDRVRPADANPAHYAHHVRVRIEGMRCLHCVRRVENTFNLRPGMMARVKLSAATADVYSVEPLEEGELRSLIARAGYAVQEVIRS